MTDGSHDDHTVRRPAPEGAAADEPTNVFPATESFPVPPAASPGHPQPPGAPPVAPPGYPQQPQYGGPPTGYPPPPPQGYPPPQYGGPPPYGAPQYGAPPPPPPDSGKGCLKAALVVGIAIVVLGIVAAVALVAVGESIDDAVKQFGTAPDNTYDARLTTCRTTATGTPEMTIEFTNRSGVARRFGVRAGYFDGEEQVGITRTTETGRLEDGESETLGLLGGITPPRGFTCRILSVTFEGR